MRRILLLIVGAVLIASGPYLVSSIQPRVIAQSPTGDVRPKSSASPSPRQPVQNTPRSASLSTPIPVKVAWVEQSVPVFDRELSGNGTVIAREDMMAQAQISGRLQKLWAYIGENVKRGTPLGEIDCEEVKSAERQAAVAVAKAEAQLNVLAATSGKRAAAVSLVRQRRADLEAVRARLALCTIKSPAEGTIAEILVGEGEVLSVGQRVVTIKPLYPFRVLLDLTNMRRSDSASPRIVIPIGNEASAADATQTYKGRVDRVITAPDDPNRITAIEIDFQLRSSQPGDRMSVTVKYRPPMEITVDPRSIIKSGTTSKVFVVDNGVAFERVVRIGATHDGVTDILAGLQGGEYVVLDPKNLRSGQAVKVEK